MSKGLKQMVEDATSSIPATPPPVEVSGDAHRVLADHMRRWSGWRDATLVLGKPDRMSAVASCDVSTHEFTVNVDVLSRNPNRVLYTVTPFRLKQEAVLTGAMLHEAAHARHSHWLPTDTERAQGVVPLHSDGADVTKQTLALARLMEEPRIEGIMAREADQIGAHGLAWTMRAMNASLMPLTNLSVDPEQKIMDLITSWAVRAGKAIALEHHTGIERRDWVNDFTSLLHNTIVDHLMAMDPDGAAHADSSKIMTLLTSMACGTDVTVGTNTMFEDETLDSLPYNHADTGTWMVDVAREVLTLLFPETDGDDEGAPMPGEGCAAEQSESEPGEQGEGDEAGSDGEGNTEPEDEGEGDEPGAGDAGPDEDGEPEDGESASPSMDDEGEPEEGEPEEGEPEEGEPEEGEPEDSDADGEPEGEGDSDETVPEDDPVQQALRDLEKAAADNAEDAEGEEVEAEQNQPGKKGGVGEGAGMGGGWRDPNKAEREIQRGAERFLRGLIEPSESSKISLTDQPSAVVDGSALAAWKAGGQEREPHFFRRTRREVQPSPPVKIAILVDVSYSMSELQKPSAILSWALSAAALDLRNFAGRGQQVESCLIHWGTRADVIQRNGQVLPGLKEFSCDQGTSAMHDACDLVEQEMPGFFDGEGDKATNRLLVQFTDWELYGEAVLPWMQRAMASGVNMLTIAPSGYAARRSDLDSIMRGCEIKRGTSTVMRYERGRPEKVWEQAAEVLA